MNFIESLVAGIPAAIVTTIIGTVIGIIIKRIDKKQQKRDESRKEFELFQVEMMSANAALGRANAIALQNGKCNGETHAALEYLEKVKAKQQAFLYKHGLDDIF